MATYNRLLTGGASAAALFTKVFPPLRSVSAAASIRRSCNTHGCYASAYEDFNRSSNEHHHSDPRVCCLPNNGFCSEMFVPVAPTQCMRQTCNMTHQSLNNPSMAASGGGESRARKAWNAKENNESLSFRFDMPGLDKDKVKVWVEESTFFIKAEPVKEYEEDEEEEPPSGYCGRFDLPVGAYKMKEIKAELKNGVLKVLVPKVKTETEERKDVWEVEVM